MLFLFLLIFLTIYGLMHFYVYYHLRRGFPQISRWRVPLFAFFGLMMLSPLIVRVLDDAEHFDLALALAPPAHAWMAVIFWFVVFGLVIDLWNNAMLGLSGLVPPTKRLRVPPKVTVTVVVILIVAGTIHGVSELQRFRARNIVLVVENLPQVPPSELDGELALPPRDNDAPSIRIVHITDVHLGLFVERKMLTRIVALINVAQPDIVVSTGDLLDSSYHDPKLVNLLQVIHAPLGKYAVLGNHEFYVTVEHSIAFHEEGGFQVIRGETIEALPGLIFAGVDDPTGGGWEVVNQQETETLAHIPATDIVILLKHRSQVLETSVGRFDLQLSGHTHGGQIFPYKYILRIIMPYRPGLHDLGRGSWLYSSRGIGFWGPPMRVFAPPEITVIDLVLPDHPKAAEADAIIKMR